MNAFASQAASDVLQTLDVTHDGLTTDDVAKRRAEHGWNELPEKKRSLWLLFLRQFHDILVYILLGALVLSLAIPLLEDGPLTIERFLDPIAIVGILLLNALLGFFQEYKAEEAIAMLRKLTSPSVRVRRGGTEQMLPGKELVPGDIVILEEGARIAADGRILEESHLEADESSLTGESQPTGKQADPVQNVSAIAEQRSMVFAGTLVTRGNGEYVVTATALRSEIGRIAALVAQTQSPETPLERKLRRLSTMLGGVVVGLSAAVVGMGLLGRISPFEALLTGATLAVSAVPEGLPAVVTICFAIGVRRMVRINALVRKLDALETLGSITVICSDKTGTITEDRMEVEQTWLAPGAQAQELALIAASCNRAVLPDLGDPTELGLLRFAAKQGIERLKIAKEEVPFTSEEKYMVTRHSGKKGPGAFSAEKAPGPFFRFLKGAPERILDEVCAPEELRAAVLAAHLTMARKGLRVLAMAHDDAFIGLIGLQDPPRSEVKDAITQARGAGIRTIMITGDHSETARAIAAQVGLAGGVLSGADLERMRRHELRAALHSTAVFARVSPLHKVRILDALREEGHIVAMTGDGVNDAPALKGAHVGIAMGRVGTDVARQAASIVLSDDHFATIVAAVREGRRIYDNIRKFILFLLRSNFDEILLITTTLFLGMPLPYLPVHLLWINLMTDSLPALALSMEPAEPGIMRRPPRPAGEHPLSGEWTRLVLTMLTAYAAALLFFRWQLAQGEPLEEARTTTLMLAILFELFVALSTRTRTTILKSNPLENPWLLAAVTVTFAAQLIVVYTPLRELLHLVPLSPAEWGEILLLASSGCVVLELLKLLPQSSRTMSNER